MFYLYVRSVRNSYSVYAIVQTINGLSKTSQYSFDSRDIKLYTKYYENCWDATYNIFEDDLRHHTLLYETESKEDMIKFVEQIPIIEELEK